MQPRIGTHNSATGELPQGLLSWLGTPFARCQSKTIREQYEAGCRFYDLRVRAYGDDWYLCHGLWRSRRTLLGVLVQLSRYPERCNVILTYEGSKNDTDFGRFVEMTDGIERAFRHINFVYTAVKRPKWEILREIDKGNFPRQGFMPIIGWRCLLPFPWLWAQFCQKNRDTNKWVLVDFL